MNERNVVLVQMDHTAHDEHHVETLSQCPEGSDHVEALSQCLESSALQTTSSQEDMV